VENVYITVWQIYSEQYAPNCIRIGWVLWKISRETVWCVFFGSQCRFDRPYICCRLLMPISIVLGAGNCESWQKSRKCRKIRVGSRSFKVIEFGTNRTERALYDFLSVTNSNFGSILHAFQVTPT